MKTLRFVSTSLVCLCFIATGLNAQATLSFQGILKKSNGIAVDDGNYSITFSLYTAETGGTPVWTENQSDVDVTSGIYSVLLGSINPLSNVSFDQIYFLGIKVGGSELTPRFKLTSSPYALALIGGSNIFPGAGTVKADELVVKGKMVVGGATAVSPTHTLQVTGGYLARGGAPGANGASNNGYAFEGNNGDKDSGLFSTGDGVVSLFVNNTERLKATGTGVDVTGNQSVSGSLSAGNLNLGPNGKVVYDGGLNDWRLVDVSDFSSGTDGWVAYDIGNPWGTSLIQQSAGTKTINNPFIQDKVLEATTPINISNRSLLKKQFDFTGKPHSEIKIEFTYYFLGTWDGEWGFGGFQQNLNEPLTGAWSQVSSTFGIFNPLSLNFRDNYAQGEMVAQYSGDKIWVAFGSTLAENAANENYAVGNIKVWIR